MTAKTPKRTGKVGYKRPPVETRFKKGQSGNPRGRPKGAKGFMAELQEVLDEVILVHEGKRSRKMTKRRVIAKRLVEGGLKGDPKAIQAIDRVDAQVRSVDSTQGEGPMTEEDDFILDRLIGRRSRLQAGGDDNVG